MLGWFGDFQNNHFSVLKQNRCIVNHIIYPTLNLFQLNIHVKIIHELTSELHLSKCKTCISVPLITFDWYKAHMQDQ